MFIIHMVYISITNINLFCQRLLSASTEDGQRRAVLRQVTIENTSKQFIEIWDKQRLVKDYDLAALDVHGDVYTDCNYL